jgi:hypothetical protein
LRCETVVPDADAATFQERMDTWGAAYPQAAQDPTQEYVLKRTVVASLTLDRLERAQAAEINRRHAEADQEWLAGRQQALAQAVADFDADPNPQTLAGLQATSEGCRWLANRWGLLAARARRGDDGPEWIAEAQRLIGRPDGLDRTFAEAADQPSRRLTPAMDRRLAYQRRADELAEVESQARRLNLDAAAIDVSPEGALRHRYEVAADRLLLRGLSVLNQGRKEHERERKKSTDNLVTQCLALAGLSEDLKPLNRAAAPNEPKAEATVSAPAPNEPNAGTASQPPPPAKSPPPVPPPPLSAASAV